MHGNRGCLFLRRLENSRSGFIAETLSLPAGTVEQSVQPHGSAFGGGQVCVGGNVAIFARVENGLYHRGIAILKYACDVDGSLRG